MATVEPLSKRFYKRRSFWFKIAIIPLAIIVILMRLNHSSPITLMPTPVKFSNSKTTIFDLKNPTDTNTNIPIFYATNRTPLVESENPQYTFIRSDILRFGQAEIRIGDGTYNWQQIRELSLSDDPEKERPALHLDRITEQASVMQNQPLSAEAQQFFKELDAAVAASPNSELIIYVHGFNNPVWRGFAQAAQFFHFTERNNVVMAFSWPSAGSMLSYATDVQTARNSASAFSNLIQLIDKHTNIKKIDILAFSAGARIASDGLALLAESENNKVYTVEELKTKLRLGQIHYAAPDEDLDRFIASLKKYINLTERVSLGANMNDSALRIAAHHQGISRAGRPDLKDLSDEQTSFLLKAAKELNFDLIKIEPNIIPKLGQRSHSFWFENPWVSSDVLMQFRWNRLPKDRGLDSYINSDGLQVWTFPQDYEKRLQDVIVEAEKQSE